MPVNAVSFTVRIRKEHRMDVVDVSVKCSADTLLAAEKQVAVRQQIEKAFSEVTGVIPAICFVKNIGEISNDKGKKVVVIDERV